jgi:hypothetical protein
VWKTATPLVLGVVLLSGLSAPAADRTPPWAEGDWCGTPVPVTLRGRLTRSLEILDKKVHRPGEIDLGFRLVWRITSGGKTYKLDFRGDKNLMDLAERLQGKNVILTGTRLPRSGSVRVTGLRADRPVPPVIEPTGFDPSTLVGLSVGEAQQRVAAKGLRFRVTGADGVAFPVTMDLRPNRVNVWLEKGIVVSANMG